MTWQSHSWVYIQKHGPQRCMHPKVHCSAIYNGQDVGATYMTIDRGMDKEDVVPVYSGILLSHEK